MDTINVLAQQRPMDGHRRRVYILREGNVIDVDFGRDVLARQQRIDAENRRRHREDLIDGVILTLVVAGLFSLFLNVAFRVFA